jgi:CBS domain containing-hemolysin-like protein
MALARRAARGGHKAVVKLLLSRRAPRNFCIGKAEKKALLIIQAFRFTTSLLQTCVRLLASLAVLLSLSPVSIAAHVVYPFAIYHEP